MTSRALSRAVLGAADAARRAASASSSSSLSVLGTAPACFAPSWRHAFASQTRVGVSAAAKAGVPKSHPLSAPGRVNRELMNQSSRAMSNSSRSSGPVGWKSLAMMAATGGGVLYFFDKERQRRLDSVKAGPSAGKASIGGPFELKLANEKGRTWKTSELHGKYALLYFGFTMCPDICPDELEKMAECVDIVNGVDNVSDKASEKVPEKGIDKDLLTPVFISIDPERDTVKRTAEYVKEFHPKLLGLTGSVDACKAAAKKYRVYYHKTGDDDSSSDDYLVDHSIIMYLVDKQGEFVTFYGKNYEAQEMAEAIIEQMKRLG